MAAHPYRAGGVTKLRLRPTSSLAAPSFVTRSGGRSSGRRLRQLLKLTSGYWRLDAAHYRASGVENFRFMRYALDAVHYLPLDDEHVVAVRVLGSFNDESGGADVPFFLKATLGGKETMRGFREFRFYDDNALLVSLEYRWRIWAFADAVLFVDEGQVAPEPRDFSLRGFKSSQGVGLRFKSDQAQILRVDIGRSREGRRLYIAFGSRF